MSARYGSGATAHIYFAADRFDNSGDSQIGFWFFNNQIAPQADGSFGPGAHKAGVIPHDANNSGDILVLSDFTNGGTQPTIRVFEWVGSGGSDGELQLLGGTTTDIRDCGTVPTDDFCASVNNFDGAAVPWLFRNKSGQASFGHGEFYEGGLNLTSLGLQNECFSSFLAETRSAQSVTATLKDFVSGPFQDCSSSIVTTPSVGQNGTASIGTGSITVHDTAAVTVNGASTFTGTLAFAICGPIATGNCVTGGTAVAAKAGVNPVTANGNYDSADVTITTAGRYCFRAVYTSGTPGVPNQADPPAGSASTTECFTITPAQPTISTLASANTVGVNLGTALNDTATLSGTSNKPNGSAAGGTITFRLYGPSASASCVNSGVGANLVGTSVVNVSGDGTNYQASTGTITGTLTPTSAGKYWWTAEYSGDPPNTLNAPAGAAGTTTTCGDTLESSIVSPSQPTISTLASANTVGVNLGTALNDTATLSGTSNKPNGSAAGGTITFRLYGPSASASCVNSGVGANLVGTSVVNVSGDGTNYQASTGTITGTLTPTSAGKYWWTAEYSGDPPNTLNAPAGAAGTTTTCGDTLESSIVISLQPTLDTAQSFVPNDQAVVNVATGAGSLAGSVRFRLYDNATCTPAGTTLYDKSFTLGTDGTVSNGGLRWTVNTDNATAYLADKTFSWLVQYTSTNNGHTNVTSACNVEHSSLTIVNGAQANTP